MRILRNRKGSSLPTALAALVVMAVMSALILSIGTVGSSRNYAASTDDEAYYLTVSLFKALNDDLYDKEVTLLKSDFDDAITTQGTLQGAGISLLSGPIAKCFLKIESDQGNAEDFTVSFDRTGLAVSVEACLELNERTKRIDVTVTEIMVNGRNVPTNHLKTMSFVPEKSETGSTLTLTYGRGQLK